MSAGTEEQSYQSHECWYWLEPLLTDAEFDSAMTVNAEARECADLIPTGDHWA